MQSNSKTSAKPQKLQPSVPRYEMPLQPMSPVVPLIPRQVSYLEDLLGDG